MDKTTATTTTPTTTAAMTTTISKPTPREEKEFQVVLLGDLGAGKSSIFYRYKTNEFLKEGESDYSFEQTAKTFVRGDYNVKVSKFVPVFLPFYLISTIPDKIRDQGKLLRSNYIVSPVSALNSQIFVLLFVFFIL